MGLDFHAQINIFGASRGLLPGRLYVHNSFRGAEEREPLDLAREYYSDITRRLSQGLRRRDDCLWMHAFLSETRSGCPLGHFTLLDSFGYAMPVDYKEDDWPSRPFVRSFHYEDESLLRGRSPVFPVEMLLVLAEEERHRRNCGSLDAYLRNPPCFSKDDVRSRV